MKDYGLDFGRLIAYFIPGTLAGWGVSYWSASLRGLLDRGTTGGTDLGDSAALVILCIVLGMVVSVARAGTIDRTFTYDMSRLPLLPKQYAHYRPRERVEPRYELLAFGGLVTALREARFEEKRPYQFYGNVLFASLFALGSRMAHRLIHCEAGGGDLALTVGSAVAVMLTLYPAARLSHFRYMRAVEAINALGERIRKKRIEGGAPA